MALTLQDKIECKQIAGKIVKEVLIEHVANCPHHQAFLISKAKVTGLIVGVVLASGVSGGTVAAAVMKFIVK